MAEQVRRHERSDAKRLKELETENGLAEEGRTPDAPLAPIPAEVLDQFVRQGPLTPEELDTAVRRFKKAIIERALGAELSHHLGYVPGAGVTIFGAIDGRSTRRTVGEILLVVTAWVTVRRQSAALQ